MRLELLYNLTLRAVQARYRGSWLGLGWSLLGPMLMLVLYTVVFTEVMRAKWPGLSDEQGKLGFAVMVYSGMVLHALIAEVLASSPMLIVGQSNYVKKVIFPLDLLPVVAVGAATVNLLIGVGLLLLLNGTIGTGLHAAALALPVILLPLLLFALGLAWLLAALGTFFRDLVQLTSFAATALLFVSPVLYPKSMVPHLMQPLLGVNPLTWPIENLRAALVNGVWPDWTSVLLHVLVFAVFARIALALYRRVQGSFADVL